MLGCVRILPDPSGGGGLRTFTVKLCRERGVLLNGKALLAPQIDVASAAMTSHKKGKSLAMAGTLNVNVFI